MPTLSLSFRPALAALAAAATLTLGLAGAPRVAHADDDRDALLVELNLFSVAVADGQDEGDRAASSFERPAADCDQVVARLARAGLKPTDVIDGREPYPFKQAGERCRTYGRWKAAIDAAAVVAHAAGDLSIAASLTPGQASAEFAVTYGKSAAACAAAIDSALASGAPPSLAVRIRSNLGDEAMTLPDLRVGICQKLADWARDFGPATIAAAQAQKEAARARYAKFGAAGDRLSWLAYYDADAKGTTWYLPGCRAEGEPKKLAKAPVLMQWWTADDGTITIRRFQFKGNKLVKDSSRAFLTEAAATAGCK